MGLVSWVKEKFNVGGLKVKILEVEPIHEESGWIKGKVVFTTESPVVAGLTYKLICETTKGTGEDKKTESATVSEQAVLIGVAMEGPGSQTEDFTFEYDLRNWLEKKGGMLGTASKLAKFAQNTFGDKGIEDYYVSVEANIKGIWVTPSDRRPVKVALAR